MIYLVDNQLPIGLVAYFHKRGLEARHVSMCGLDRATDQEIWKYAKENDCVIVSKDEDFFHLSATDSSAPPLVWIRLGNCRNNSLFAAFEKVMPDLLEAIAAGAKVVEIR